MTPEQYIKSKLDGRFFYISEAGRTVFKPVAHDYIPDYKASWSASELEEGQVHCSTVKFTPEQDDLIVSMRGSGSRWADIAKACRRDATLTRSRYHVLCAERGITPAPRTCARATKFSDQVKSQVYAMRLNGMPYEVIAEQMGMTKWQCVDMIAKLRKLMKAAA